MLKKLGFKGFLFLVPLLVLLGIFSFWPVLQSLTYTFFDYQLNDQQKSGLYLSERFNTDLFDETSLYVTRFLEEELEIVTESEDQDRIKSLVARVDSVNSKFSEEERIITISEEQKDEILKLHDDAVALMENLNQKYELRNNDNLIALIEDFDNSVIPSNFIGLEGYKKALTDERVGVALTNTVLFTVASVFLELILGLGLALIMNKTMFGQGVIRTTSLIPWAIPTAVAALMWSYLYDGSSGIIALFFENIGLVEDSRDLLLSGGGAMVSTILADVWKTTPYMALLLLAGLQNIPRSLYEAASVDGAGRIGAFFRITLPLLKPSILVALLFRTLDAFRVFDLIYVLTGGGPGGATETLSIYTYKVMFGQTNFGYGSVIVMLMFLCVAIIAIIYIKILGTNLMEKN